jgi:hypothetical protein
MLKSRPRNYFHLFINVKFAVINGVHITAASKSGSYIMIGPGIACMV